MEFKTKDKGVRNRYKNYNKAPPPVHDNAHLQCDHIA